MTGSFTRLVPFLSHLASYISFHNVLCTSVYEIAVSLYQEGVTSMEFVRLSGLQEWSPGFWIRPFRPSDTKSHATVPLSILLNRAWLLYAKLLILRTVSWRWHQSCKASLLWDVRKISMTRFKHEHNIPHNIMAKKFFLQQFWWSQNIRCSQEYYNKAVRVVRGPLSTITLKHYCMLALAALSSDQC